MHSFFQDILSCLETSCFDKQAEDHVQSYLSVRNDLPFMTMTALEDVMDRLALDTHHRRVLRDARDVILKHSRIHELIKFSRHLIIGAAHPSHWLVKGAPLLKQGDVASSSFALMTLLALVPDSLETHRSKGIDFVHVDFNLGHLKGYIKQHHDKHGTVGVENFGWCTYLASLGLIKLGCLQFMHHVFTDRFRFFRHRRDQRLCALVEAGVNVRIDGQFDGVNSISRPAFTTTLACDEHGCSGHRVNPCGSIEKETTTLAFKNWKLVIRKGDPVIDFHIPSKSAYGIDDIRQSFKLAKTFLRHIILNTTIRPFGVFLGCIRPSCHVSSTSQPATSSTLPGRVMSCQPHQDRKVFSPSCFNTSRQTLTSMSHAVRLNVM